MQVQVIDLSSDDECVCVGVTKAAPASILIDSDDEKVATVSPSKEIKSTLKKISYESSQIYTTIEKNSRKKRRNRDASSAVKLFLKNLLDMIGLCPSSTLYLHQRGRSMPFIEKLPLTIDNGVDYYNRFKEYITEECRAATLSAWEDVENSENNLATEAIVSGVHHSPEDARESPFNIGEISLIIHRENQHTSLQWNRCMQTGGVWLVCISSRYMKLSCFAATSPNKSDQGFHDEIQLNLMLGFAERKFYESLLRANVSWQTRGGFGMKIPRSNWGLIGGHKFAVTIQPIATTTQYIRMYVACHEETQFNFMHEWMGGKVSTHTFFNSDDEAIPAGSADNSKNLKGQNNSLLLNLFGLELNLTDSQSEAVWNILGGSNNALQLVQGPPGTGKTTTIVATLMCMAMKASKLIEQGSKGPVVFVCASSNKAVQVVLEKFLEALERHSLEGKVRVALTGVQDKLPSGRAGKMLKSVYTDEFSKQWAVKLNMLGDSLRELDVISRESLKFETELENILNQIADVKASLKKLVPATFQKLLWKYFHAIERVLTPQEETPSEGLNASWGRSFQEWQEVNEPPSNALPVGNLGLENTELGGVGGWYECKTGDNVDAILKGDFHVECKKHARADENCWLDKSVDDQSRAEINCGVFNEGITLVKPRKRARDSALTVGIHEEIDGGVKLEKEVNSEDIEKNRSMRTKRSRGVDDFEPGEIVELISSSCRADSGIGAPNLLESEPETRAFEDGWGSLVVKKSGNRDSINLIRAASYMHDAAKKLTFGPETCYGHSANRHVNSISRELLSKANFIFCTVNVCGRRTMMGLFKPDMLILDEAAQSPEAETLIALQLNPKKCLLVGDPRQLSCNVQSKVAEMGGFGRSAMERLMMNGYKHIMLANQFRMHPEISQFPSNEYYDQKLKNDPMVLERPVEPWHKKGLGPYTFVNVSNSSESGGKECLATHSFRNVAEANVISKIICALKMKYGVQVSERVCIITFYSGQVICIKNALESTGIVNVPVHTVDSFQGSESDIVLISFVRSNKNSSVGFISDYRRINVAVTRARTTCVLVGNAATLAPQNVSSTHVMEQDIRRSVEVLVTDACRRGCMVSEVELMKRLL